ncbi:MAG: elongator complex protein 3 [bacterium]
MDLEKFVIELAKKQPITKRVLEQEKRFLFKGQGESKFLQSSALLVVYKKLLESRAIKRNKSLEVALRLKHIRSLSGVSVVTVLTKPWPCPGECVYCPTEPNMPKSYLASEPAAQRALQNKFDPYKQVISRLTQYKNTGHPTDKIELIILGGSFNAYLKGYQEWFVSECFRATNEFVGAAPCGRPKATGPIESHQKVNETAKNRIVFLSVETRPDLITKEEALWLRTLGVTKVELGVQSLDNEVLKLCNRGHAVAETAKATKILKNLGFKVCYHIMPNLPGATPAKDLAGFKKLFSDSRFQPDMLKIYPCVVLPGTKLEEWHQQGKFQPYSTEELIELLVAMKKAIPPYVRLNRLIRDIPEFEIVAGNKVTSLRQVVQKCLCDAGFSCRCIRCREIRGRTTGKLVFEKIAYPSSAGKEIFLQWVDEKDRLYGLLRLLLPRTPAAPFLKNCALVRELHIFGQEVKISGSSKTAIQHKGLGKKLLKEAEKIAKGEGYKKLAVISGVGVREYYRKLGYNLQDTYMVKYF